MKDLYIITGATGGMGYESALHFSKKGKVLLLDLSLEALYDIRDEIKTDCDVLKFNITNDDDIQQVANYVRENGGFKYLLHYAGVSESMGNSELIYNINLVGTKKLLDALYDYVLPGGVIINTSSMTGHLNPTTPELDKLLAAPLAESFMEEILKVTPSPTQAYGWSKNGLMALTRREVGKWAMKKARILSISPGAIKTPMVEKEMEKNKGAIDQLIQTTPMKRIGLSEDIVNLVDFLVSEKASFITGTDILIDGGATEIFKQYYNKAK